MRLVGITPEALKAEGFVHFLKNSGTESLVRPENQEFGVWVINEDRVVASRIQWARYLENPLHSDFVVSLPLKKSGDEEDRDSDFAEKSTEIGAAAMQGGLVLHHSEAPVWHPATGLVAFAMIAVSVLTWFGDDQNELFKRLTFGTMGEDGSVNPFNPKDPWRAFTPIFVHLSAIQLLFNLLMFQELAGQVEQRLGRFRLIMMIMFFAFVSNMAEGYFGPTRLFGGLSGIVFALFGFIWMRAVYAPWTGFTMSTMTIMLLSAWFLMSMVNPAIPPSTWAHGAGFCSGVVLGVFAPAGIKPEERVAPSSNPVP